MNEYLKENWSEQFKADFEALPKIIKEYAGDLFELKWYGGGDLKWELENNWLDSKEQVQDFLDQFNTLTKHQLNLIYYAYEA